jgi:hypothetical protein
LRNLGKCTKNLDFSSFFKVFCCKNVIGVMI